MTKPDACFIMTSADACAPTSTFSILFLLSILILFTHVFAVPVTSSYQLHTSIHPVISSNSSPHPSYSVVHKSSSQVSASPSSISSNVLPSNEEKPSENQTTANPETKSETSSSLALSSTSPIASSHENKTMNKNQEAESKVKNTEKDSTAYHQDAINESETSKASSDPISSKHHKRMSTGELIAEARAQHRKIMNDGRPGFLEFFEWMFVLILVAPGTFPAMGCVLLTCTSFWRRRFSGANQSVFIPNLDTVATENEVISLETTNIPRSPYPPASPYQRTSTSENGSFVVRARLKAAAADDRDTDVS